MNREEFAELYAKRPDAKEDPKGAEDWWKAVSAASAEIHAAETADLIKDNVPVPELALVEERPRAAVKPRVK
jgi:hypothetical protein